MDEPEGRRIKVKGNVHIKHIEKEVKVQRGRHMIIIRKTSDCDL